MFSSEILVAGCFLHVFVGKVDRQILQENPPCSGKFLQNSHKATNRDLSVQFFGIQMGVKPPLPFLSVQKDIELQLPLLVGGLVS